MTASAIEVEHLTKNFGSVSAVDDVSFRVAQGELVGFLGLNGAGKSTTIRILTTFLPASSGLASVAGYDVMTQSLDVRANLGYLPESVPLYPELRVVEYLTMRAKLKRVDRTTRTARIDYCLERCRIAGVRQRLIGTLSKGYRQRVGLADAMLSDPKILILDEPLSGLDPIQQEETLGSIRDLRGRHTVLFSSHQLADVEKICDRVLIIHRGRLQFDGSLNQIAKRTPSIVVELKADRELAASHFRSIDGVQSVAASGLEDGWQLISIQAAERDLREAIARSCFDRGWALRRVELKREKLEDTFMKVAYQRG